MKEKHATPPGTTLAELLNERQVIPRWRAPVDGKVELVSSNKIRKQPTERQQYWIANLESRATETRNPIIEAELSQTRFVLGLEPDDSVLLDKYKAQARQLTHASHVLCPEKSESREEIHVRIARIKAQVRQNPGRTLAWAELARSYLSLGQRTTAARAIEAALHLNPNDRYIVRCAARLWVQLEQPEKAQSLLSKHPGVRRDPWILSAEIACAALAEKSSRLTTTAREMIESRSHGARDLSELAAAIGTLEHTSGSSKKAARYFTSSLVDPTDNALAQALWARNRESNFKIPTRAWEIPSAHEAKALAALSDQEWDRVSQFAKDWIEDEPFSMSAAVLGSTPNFSENQIQISIEIASKGLLAFPNDVGLLNNRAASYALKDDTDSAKRDIEQALTGSGGKTKPYLLATAGLLLYRLGSSIGGAQLYLTAMNWFIELKDETNAILAALYWLHEEALTGGKEALALLATMEKTVDRVADRNSRNEMIALIKKIRALQGIDPSPRGLGLFPEDPSYYLDRFEIPKAAFERVRDNWNESHDECRIKEVTKLATESN